MHKLTIVVHGGAGPDSEFIRKNHSGYLLGLRQALNAGYDILAMKGTALDAVEAAVRSMEDNPLFNCGCGSALNEAGEVEMCASIMDGKDKRSGAVAIARRVKNPVSLAKRILFKKDLIYLGAEGALKFAEKEKLELMEPAYFETGHQLAEYKKNKEEKTHSRSLSHGTVGAVAIDHEGNIAAATSTGGSLRSAEGRISDSGMIGVGCYAENQTCAVSCTGDGEYIIRGVLAHSIAAKMRYTTMDIERCCREAVHSDNRIAAGDIGVIALDREGNFSLEFNSERMHRGWKTDEETKVFIY